MSVLDFLGEKLFLRQSTNNLRWVDYLPTDNGDFHKTQVIKLQEMKLKSKVNHHQFICVIHTILIVKHDLKMIIPAGLRRFHLSVPHCFQRHMCSCLPSPHAEPLAGPPRR